MNKKNGKKKQKIDEKHSLPQHVEAQPKSKEVDVRHQQLEIQMLQCHNTQTSLACKKYNHIGA